MDSARLRSIKQGVAQQVGDRVYRGYPPEYTAYTDITGTVHYVKTRKGLPFVRVI